ncbi:Hypothetical protein NTJ_03854 [Nesidiocoris tenuis]|uniref:Uncharacterized protein n=1 Tax=Nesidiocoris tenuis TaxID=355587 RepID=A0ABN7AFI8_9HEMI|nr:Hypothetical protein NTJ_03854 [Nesidiocoris tenuis]
MAALSAVIRTYRRHFKRPAGHSIRQRRPTRTSQMLSRRARTSGLFTIAPALNRSANAFVVSVVRDAESDSKNRRGPGDYDISHPNISAAERTPRSSNCVDRGDTRQPAGDSGP